jgi:hypothetical protein
MKKACRSFFFSSLTLAVFVVLAACTSQPAPVTAIEPPLDTETQAPAAQGLYGVIDACQAVSEAAGGSSLNVFTANFYTDNTQDGFYILDLGTLIQAEVGEDCSFDLPGVPDGQYVLLVGATAESSLLLVDEDGAQVVFTVISGQPQNAGTLFARP